MWGGRDTNDTVFIAVGNLLENPVWNTIAIFINTDKQLLLLILFFIVIIIVNNITNISNRNSKFLIIILYL